MLLIISDHDLTPLREILRCRFLEIFLQNAINDAFLVAIELLVHPQICLLLNFQYMFHDLTYLPGLLDLFFLNFEISVLLFSLEFSVILELFTLLIEQPQILVFARH